MRVQTTRLGTTVKHTIKPDSEGLTVEVSDAVGQQEHLLTEFQACREGRCSCPTDEYEKLDSMEIDNSDGKMSLRLRVKPGKTFDSHEIEKCLDHTAKKLDPSG